MINIVMHVNIGSMAKIEERSERRRNRQVRKVCTGHKSEDRKGNLVIKFSNQGEVVVDPCVGAFARANACTIL